MKKALWAATGLLVLLTAAPAFAAPASGGASEMGTAPVVEDSLGVNPGTPDAPGGDPLGIARSRFDQRQKAQIRAKLDEVRGLHRQVRVQAAQLKQGAQENRRLMLQIREAWRNSDKSQELRDKLASFRDELGALREKRQDLREQAGAVRADARQELAAVRQAVEAGDFDGVMSHLEEVLKDENQALRLAEAAQAVQQDTHAVLERMLAAIS